MQDTPQRNRSLLLKLLQVAIVLIALLIEGNAAKAEDLQIRVVAGVVEPFVMEEDGKLTGFAIEIWEEVARRIGATTEYTVVDNLTDLYGALKNDKADVAVSALVYTIERDKEFDFTFPIMEAGFGIMVPDASASGLLSPLESVFGVLFSWMTVAWMGVGFLIMLVPAHIVWLLDRGKEDGPIPSRAYFPGILQALVFAATALVSQVQVLPRQWLARAFALVWMFGGVLFISIYTAELTASVTIEQIAGAINDARDLPGKKVGAVEGGAAVNFLQEIGAKTVLLPTVKEVLQALIDGDVDAIVGGAPVLRYYAANEGAGTVKLVGGEFLRRPFGFVVQLQSPLRRKINTVLIGMGEDGTYDAIYETWFNPPE